MREGLARILQPPRFRVVASGPNIEALDTSALAHYDAQLLVIESGDSAATDIEHIDRFKRERPSSRVAVLANHWRPADILAAFQAGANVYFAQVTASEEFLKAIELVMLGQTILPSELLPWVRNPENVEWSNIAWSADVPAQQPRFRARSGAALSVREQGILQCIIQGASNKMIAREIDISEATVKVHVKTILRKIGVSNRTQAAIWALTNRGPSSGEGRYDSPPLGPHCGVPTVTERSETDQILRLPARKTAEGREI